jgi:A/G-specific adenine glycosylase
MMFTFLLGPGLLAGLYEFPTSANVSGASASAQSKIPHALLTDLLQSAPAPYTTSNFFTPKSRPAVASSPGLQISKIKPAGDVIHVFSHIKKTYRVQWVVLEGGGSEPPLLAPRVLPVESPTKRKRKAGAEGNKASVNTEGHPEPMAKWTPLDENMDARCVLPLLYLC